MTQEDLAPSSASGPTLTLAPNPAATGPVTPTKITVRLWSLFGILVFGAMLAVGLWLKPSSTGVETHRQLFLPPCGMYAVTGLPCPTCGCTTAVSLVSHGHWLKAILTQPFGAAVGFFGMIVVALSIVGLITGRWIGPDMITLGFYWKAIFTSSAALLVLAWIYKIIIVKLHYGV